MLSCKVDLFGSSFAGQLIDLFALASTKVLELFLVAVCYCNL